MACQTVVVLEQDELVRETLLDVLTSIGYGAVGVTSLEELRHYLAQHPGPCLILADLLSSASTGSDLLSLRRADDVLLQIPVAVMSSTVVGDGQEGQASRLGADAYLKKPFDLDHFIETVHRYCQSLE